MVSKRKRTLEEFDHNKSDSGDENFDPSRDRPQKSSKKSRPARPSRHSRSRGTRYRGSDIDDDDDQELSDSQDDSFGDHDEESPEDAEAPVNAAGRRARKAAIKRQTYKESSDEDDMEEIEDAEPARKSKGRSRSRIEAEADAESDQEEMVTRSRVVKLKVPKSAQIPTNRRSTRASTADTDDHDLVELSNSGRHAIASRDSASKSPEPIMRTRRSSRAMKGVKAPPEPIEPIQEATQESSIPAPRDDDADDAEPEKLSPGRKPSDTRLSGDEEMQDAAAPDPETRDDPPEGAAQAEPVASNNEEDDDDVPLTRRTRSSRGSLAAASKAKPDDDAVETTGRRLRRRSQMKKPAQEPSSDFEPGDDSDDGEMSKSETGKAQDDDDTPTPRGRPNRRSGRNSRRSPASEDFDMDELNEEARELRQTSRPRRRPRRESPIVYQEHARRSRAKVNYYMPPLTVVNIEDEEAEDPAPTPSRNRRRGGGGGGWDRNLNTTFGPFGGGGRSLLAGPWGTVAAGGADSDSSDDEMVHRSSVAGNVGMTPTSAAPGGFLGAGHGLAAEAVGATPNVGKIKDRKALADADPLGVDMNVDFGKVGGLQGHIDQLKEMVQLPLLYPELFTKFHVTPPRGVLFHGPPGTGKTLLARALANSVGSGGRKISFYMRKGADALSKWVGEAEKQLRLLFEEARKTQPSIIFFDEIDGLAPIRSSKQEQIHASIVSTLLALMDGMDGRGQVIVIGATNRPDNIDPALRRPGRFDREFYFPLPDIQGRRAILDIHTKDWGLPEDFKASLAEKTKGYGGADLRALCTEAALNSIQRTYPQIYSSREKLIVDADKISIHASDFMMCIKRLIPSSERSATSGPQPLPKSVEPLLRLQLDEAKRALDNLLPRKKKMTALEEAMYEQFDDDDHGFGRETMYQEFERSRVYRPRFLIHGDGGMGQGYIASAVLHHFEGVHVQNFDLPSLLADGRPTEQVIVGLFAEVRRHKPSVIYIPNMDAWYAALAGTVALTTFQTMLRSIAPTDPVLLLATAECSKQEVAELTRDFFGFSRKNKMEVARPEREFREEYFGATLEYVKKKPAAFPDPQNRKKRVLPELPIAPTIAPKPPTKAERKALQKRDHQLLNALKIQLQPIMDQINRRYRKFRQPVIPPSQIEYLFVESDPNYVRADLPGAETRPFEIVKDKHGCDVLRETATGKCYHNLETTTIEERLSNGFYARPKDFLSDVKALARDAKNAGDKERTLKANELLSNVEVDVASIESTTAHMEWEGLYQRQLQRAREAAEKERRQKALQSMADKFQAGVGSTNNNNETESDSQGGPLTLGERVPTSLSAARFRLRSPPTNGHGEPGGAQGDGGQEASNGGVKSYEAPGDEDVRMGGVDADVEVVTPHSSAMGPPPKVEGGQQRSQGPPMTQISQKSAVTPLPPGVSPSAVLNEAASTKTSDVSTRRESNWSTQLTNGNNTNHGHGSGRRDSHESDDGELPDTLPVATQTTSSDEAWPHSQAHGLLARSAAAGSAGAAASGAQPPSSQARDPRSSGSGDATGTSGHPGSSGRHGSPHEAGAEATASAASASAAPRPESSSSQSGTGAAGATGTMHSMMPRGSGASSQPVSVEDAVSNFLHEVADGTSGCTIEQLEQINRELMDEIWRRRHEWNRIKVLNHVTQVFNDTIGEIETCQGMGPLSQLVEEE